MKGIMQDMKELCEKREHEIRRLAKDEGRLSTGQGRCNLGGQGVGLGKELFVSLLQVSKKGMDGFLGESRQLVKFGQTKD